MAKSIYDCPKCNGYASSVSCAGIHWRECYNCGLKSNVGFTRTESNDNWKEKIKKVKK